MYSKRYLSAGSPTKELKSFIDPKKLREIDFFFRGSIKYNRNTIKFHREKLFNDLKTKLYKKNFVSVIGRNVFYKKKISNFIKKAQGKLSNSEYLKIQNNVKIKSELGNMMADEFFFDLNTKKLKINSFNDNNIKANIKIDEKRF